MINRYSKIVFVAELLLSSMSDYSLLILIYLFIGILAYDFKVIFS